VLARIVEERHILAERAFDDFLEGLALELGAFQQIVAVGHVGCRATIKVRRQRQSG